MCSSLSRMTIATLSDSRLNATCGRCRPSARKMVTMMPPMSQSIHHSFSVTPVRDQVRTPLLQLACCDEAKRLLTTQQPELHSVRAYCLANPTGTGCRCPTIMSGMHVVVHTNMHAHVRQLVLHTCKGHGPSLRPQGPFSPCSRPCRQPSCQVRRPRLSSAPGTTAPRPIP